MELHAHLHDLTQSAEIDLDRVLVRHICELHRLTVVDERRKFEDGVMAVRQRLVRLDVHIGRRRIL